MAIINLQFELSINFLFYLQMHSFGWKRKAKTAENDKPIAFQDKESDAYEVEEGVDWLTATKRPKV